MIKKIPIDELRTGMYVCGLEKDEPGNVLFFMNNILVRNGGDIQRFQNNGYKSVYIELDDEPSMIEDELIASEEPSDTALDRGIEDIEEPESVERPVIIEEPFAGSSSEDSAYEVIPEELEGGDKVIAFFSRPAGDRDEDGEKGEAGFYDELKEAKRIRDEAEGLAREFLSSVRKGEEIRSGKVHDAVDKMVGSVFRNQDALTSLARLKSADDYTFAHSVNVCILSLTLGRHLGLDKESLHDLGVGAILHDIGKMLVPQSILKKPARLTEPEFSEMKKHTLLGAELLLKTKEINEESRVVALQHHEKFDGSGYHKMLKGRDIHPFARIAAVADVYDAMTSNRVYQRGIVPEEAMKKMYLLRDSHFEPELVERLIKCLGIYPIGTLIELNTGEIAIVRMPNHTHPLQPVITMLFDRDKRPFSTQFDVDLKDEIGRWIVSSRDPDSFDSFSEILDGITA